MQLARVKGRGRGREHLVGTELFMECTCKPCKQP